LGRLICALHATCSSGTDFGTRAGRRSSHHAPMDVIAVLIAVMFTALLLWTIKGIDRI
jgi:hypothetical protein